MYATIPKAGFLCKGEYNNSNRGIGEPPGGGLSNDGCFTHMIQHI